MNRVHRRLAVILLGCLAVHLRAAPSSAQPPNVIIIYTDDLGYGDVGCYGATKVRTPNIDRLAREGRRFTDAHSVSAVCSPSRYALLTGEYPFRVNRWGPIFARVGLIIDPAKLTLPRFLQQQGYATTCIGKWHLGFGAMTPDWNGELKPGPLELGFDSFFGLPTVSSHSPFVLVENHRVLGLDPADPLVFDGEPATRPFPEKIVATQAMSGARAAHALYDDEQLGVQFTERAVRWIHTQKNKPFFLYFSTPHIHHPFTPHPRFRGTSHCGLYGDFIHELDWMVGQLLQALDELKLAENTLVIFTSDNGAMLNDGARAAWNAGHRINGDLLGFKFGAWEGGHRVPFIVRWPRRVPANTTSDALIANIDVFATIASITGKPFGASDAVDSYDILPAWTERTPKPVRDHLIIAPTTPKNITLRKDKWVYISAQGDGGRTDGRGGPLAVVFSGRAHSDLTPEGNIRPDAPTTQLYDLERDPQQSTNVVREHPALASELATTLERYRNANRTAPLLKAR